MTERQRQARIHHLVMAGADVTRRPRRPKDAELCALVATGPRKPAAAPPAPFEYRSYLDAQGVRRWKDAAGREVRYADLPAVIRSADNSGAVRHATSHYVTR